MGIEMILHKKEGLISLWKKFIIKKIQMGNFEPNETLWKFEKKYHPLWNLNVFKVKTDLKT